MCSITQATFKISNNHSLVTFKGSIKFQLSFTISGSFCKIESFPKRQSYQRNKKISPGCFRYSGTLRDGKGAGKKLPRK